MLEVPMWLVEKVINNNVVNAIDKNNKEAILTGKGIGFQKKKGELIDSEKIEKIFLPDMDKQSYKLEEIFKDTPIEFIKIVTECIEYGKQFLKKELNANLYITLIEHLNLVLQRVKQGAVLNNPMLFDMKHFYPQEFAVAEYTRNRINQVLGVHLPIDETGFLTMHFLNAENESNGTGQIMNTTQFLQDVFRIIEEQYEIKLDPTLYEYGRFVTHLKYLSQKIFEGIQEEDDDDEFYISVQEKHKEAYECVKKIEAYIKEEYEFLMSQEEKMYLTVYIKRILLKTQKSSKKVVDDQEKE